MARDGFSVGDQHAAYFLTAAVVDRMDVFTRPVYKDIIVSSLNYCIQHKGLELFAWTLMTNHLHLVGRTARPRRMSDFLCDFKKFTSKRLSEAIIAGPESRQEWMIPKLSYWARATARAKVFKLWQDGSHPILVEQSDLLKRSIRYTHLNAVRQGIVEHPHEYLHSSARNYAGMAGLVPVTVLDFV